MAFKEGQPASDEGKEAAQSQLVGQLLTKKFKSGKTGYYAQGKIQLGADRFQSQVQLVKIEKKED